jgi:hypothetical protein
MDGGSVVMVARVGEDLENVQAASGVGVVGSLDLVTSPGGRLALAWERDGRVEAVVGDGATISAPSVLSRDAVRATSPRVCLREDGKALAVWAEDGSRVAMAGTNGVGWVAASTIADGGGPVARPAITAAAGVTAAMWTAGDGGLVGALHVGDRWQVVELATPGTGAFGPTLVAEPSGHLTVGWVRSGGTVQVASVDGREWSPAQVVGVPASGASGLRLACLDGDETVAQWTSNGGNVTRARRMGAAGWGAAEPVEDNAWGPRLAGHGSGWCIGAWHSGGVTVRASVRDPAGVWSDAETLSREGERCRYPAGVVTGAGHVACAWRRDDGTIQLSRWEAARWSPAVDLCAPGGALEPPLLAALPDGALAVGWIAPAP